MLKTDDATPQTSEGRRLPSPDRNLTVSPLDMRQAKFGTAMRGRSEERRVGKSVWRCVDLGGRQIGRAHV